MPLDAARSSPVLQLDTRSPIRTNPKTNVVHIDFNNDGLTLNQVLEAFASVKGDLDAPLRLTRWGDILIPHSPPSAWTRFKAALSNLPLLNRSASLRSAREQVDTVREESRSQLLMNHASLEAEFRSGVLKLIRAAARQAGDETLQDAARAQVANGKPLTGRSVIAVLEPSAKRLLSLASAAGPAASSSGDAIPIQVDLARNLPPYVEVLPFGGIPKDTAPVLGPEADEPDRLAAESEVLEPQAKRLDVRDGILTGQLIAHSASTGRHLELLVSCGAVAESLNPPETAVETLIEQADKFCDAVAIAVKQHCRNTGLDEDLLSRCAAELLRWNPATVDMEALVTKAANLYDEVKQASIWIDDDRGIHKTPVSQALGGDAYDFKEWPPKDGDGQKSAISAYRAELQFRVQHIVDGHGGNLP